MGYIGAYDSMNFMSLEMGIEHHLRYNVFPPIPLKYKAVCIKAIEICVKSYFEKDGLDEKKIRIPDTAKKIYQYLTPNEIVECFRLDAFVDYHIEKIEWKNKFKKRVKR